MRTIDLPAPDDDLIEFLMHQEVSPGVKELVRATNAEAAAVLLDALGIDAIVEDEVDAYFLANLNWAKSSATKSLHGDSSDGIELLNAIVSGVTQRIVMNPRRTDSVTALDITPRGAHASFSGGTTGIRTWLELCNKDFLQADFGNSFESARLSIYGDGIAELGTHLFNGSAVLTQLWFAMDDVRVGLLRGDGRHYALGGHDSGQYTIADDAAMSLSVPGAANLSSPCFLVQVDTNRYSNPQPRGCIAGRVGSSVLTPFNVNLQSATNVSFTTGALTGTTGSDGNITFSGHTDKKLYIENRSGGSIKFALNWMAQQ